MTLQERMIQAYLRQADLPPGEKEKLKLFLILLDETYREESEQSRAEQSRAEQSRAEQSRAEQSRAPAPEMPATTFSYVDYGAGEPEATTPPAPMGATSPDKGRQGKSVDPLAAAGASEAPAKRSSADAPGEEGKTNKAPDPLAEPLLKALEKTGLSLEEAAAEKHIGVRASVLQKVLDGEPIRKDSREKISRWVQGVGIAVTDGI